MRRNTHLPTRGQGKEHQLTHLASHTILLAKGVPPVGSIRFVLHPLYVASNSKNLHRTGAFPIWSWGLVNWSLFEWPRAHIPLTLPRKSGGPCGQTVPNH